LLMAMGCYFLPCNSSARALAPYSLRSASTIPAEWTATVRFFSPS